jgi:hypothetical protein
MTKPRTWLPMGGKRLAAILAEMIAGGGNDHA